jgi:hypothetical protein
MMGSRRILLSGFAAIALAGLLPAPATAHCDGLDGPVVGAARQALDAGDPNPVLVWVRAEAEAAIRAAFADALAVRRLGPQARRMADTYFFETLVRLHRAGEGAPYTGLKPAGRDLGPAIPLADKAVESGSERELAAFLAREVEQGVHARFEDLRRKRGYKADDLAGGRDHVASYVTFVHYVEALHETATRTPGGHYPEEGHAQAEKPE